jgi:glycosyltransferase involved in cell wall biosynthesis
MKPLISIITTVYNNEKYIQSAVDSVLSQGIKDMEYIIVDDGSTDRTPAVVDAIAATDSRIKVIHQNNQWIYAGFNNGIKAASGEYIYILNSDDRLKEGSLQKLIAIVEKYHPDVIYTPVMVHKCDENQSIIHEQYFFNGKGIEQDLYIPTNAALKDNWIRLEKGGYNINQANLYKRRLALEHPFRNDVYGADYLFNISIAPYISSAYVMTDPVYDFFIYDKAEMNASDHKYYGYEHSMFTQFYQESVDLLEWWGIKDTGSYAYFERKRFQKITPEIRTYSAPNCNLTVEEKIARIFTINVDELLYNLALKLDAMEELEARVLSGCRELLVSEEIRKDSPYRFVYDLLDGLLRYEKTPEDMALIEAAVKHPLNPYKIGQSFLEKCKCS